MCNRTFARYAIWACITLMLSACSDKAALTTLSAAEVPTASATKQDIAILEAVMNGECAKAAEKIHVISDLPASVDKARVPDGWDAAEAMALTNGLVRRSNEESWKWPHVQVCEHAQVADGSAIEATFARDQRRPPGWDNFHAEFPGSGRLVKLSRPAFSKDGATAAVYIDSSCDVGCAVGLYLKLTRTKEGWRITNETTAWIG